ncbi:MAG TPA: discoidin domain-containing protein [Polyangia bacterium]|nr:discoidin domain-containing protein [Polyangia bacterium]
MASIRIFAALAAVAACTGAEPFRLNGRDGGGLPGSGGGFGGLSGTGGLGGTGGFDGTAGSGGTGGSGGTAASGGSGGLVATGGSGGAIDAPAFDSVDSPSERTPDASVDVPVMMDTTPPRDVPPDVPVQPIAFLNYCNRVHWTATASATSPNYPVEDAIDGRPATRWSSGKDQAGDESFEIDFGGPVKFNQVVLDYRSGNQTDYPRGYRISTSANGTTFTSVLGPVAVNQSPGALLTINLPLSDARVMRISQTGTGTNWWSINEIRFGCQPGMAPPPGAIDPFDPGNWKAMASSSLGGAVEGNAFDGDPLSRWTTGMQQRGTETFRLDIGAATNVSQVILEAPAGNAPQAYRLELSTDGVAFTTVASGNGMQLTQIAFATRRARFLLVRQTGTATNVWSISEITVKP